MLGRTLVSVVMSIFSLIFMSDHMYLHKRVRARGILVIDLNNNKLSQIPSLFLLLTLLFLIFIFLLCSSGVNYDCSLLFHSVSTHHLFFHHGQISHL